MAQPDSQDRLRLAFSYAEKAGRLLRELEGDVASGRIDRRDEKSLRKSYARHLTLSSRLIDGERKGLLETLESLEKQKANLERKRDRAGTQAASGQISVDKANDISRELTNVLTGLADEILAVDTLIAGASSNDLGGMMDLPLEEYASRLISQRPSLPLVSPLYTVVVYLLGAAALGGGALLLLEHGPHTWGVAIDGEVSVEGTFVGTFTNNERHAIRLYLPWPESRGEADGDGHAYGVDVYIREEGDGAFRLSPPYGEAWKAGGVPVTRRESVSVDVGLSTDVVFDPTVLEDFGLRVVAWRIVFSDETGGEVYTIKTETRAESSSP